MGTTKDLLDERFVPVQDYPNYEVSNYGRVVNVVSNSELRIQTDHSGQRYVGLYRRNICTKISIRRLVAQAFFADYQPWMDVFLISDNKDDCSVRNITLQRPEGEKRVMIVETGETFETVYKLAKHIGGSPAVVSKVLMGMGKSHKGFTFKWIEKS